MWPGFRNIFATGPWRILAVLFTFRMGVLRRIFRFEEEVFVVFELGYGSLLFGIGGEIGTTLTGIGGIPDFIFGSVIHEG